MTEPDLDPIEHRLREERPVPSPGFRGEIRRHLSEGAPGEPTHRRAALVVAAYASSGGLLLAIAAASVAGIGPLAS